MNNYVIREKEHAFRIKVGTMPYKELNYLIYKKSRTGFKNFILDDVIGQRYIGAGMNYGIKIEVNGIPGQDVGVFNSGSTIVVNGNAQDGVGNTMNDGFIIVHGNVGDIPGHMMRNGKIYIRGSAGFRAGIMMKEYRRKKPVIIIGERVGDYLGEYMAGGRIIVLGYDLSEDESPVGHYIGSGMFGGTIWIRGNIAKNQLGKGSICKEVKDGELEEILPFIEEYAEIFNLSLDKILSLKFWKVTKLLGRPFGKLYVPSNKIGGELFPLHTNLKSPCSNACPIGIPNQQIIKKIRDGEIKEAYEIIDDYTPFRYTCCGLSCPRFCEQACTRNSINDPVPIAEISKKYAPKGKTNIREEQKDENQSDGGKSATLFGVLDYTKTAMGSRLLKWVIQNPIRSLEEIKKRQDRVEWFYNNRQSIDKIRSSLGNVLDIERIVSKISVGKANARDLIGLKNTLINAEQIFGYLNDIESFNEFVNQDYEQNDVISLINRAIVEDPPLSIKEGGIIKYGYNQKLDEYRRIRDENREWINKYQVEQRNRTGINNLRIGYNKVIGYYIEVTKANLPKVPLTYIRKQTLVNAERFTTEELELHQAKLREAREMSDNLEYEIFMEICQIILKKMDKLYSIANSIASIDLFQSFAMAAMVNGYVRPEIVEENVLEITGGRHPVIERFVDVDFIENDLHLNNSDRRIMILTGPNMSGKSTYLRQNALIIIMAHMGSFVPASSAKIGVVDRIFSRIGMSDRLIKGESTFLVEMIETSRILHYSTPRSFVIMDEIGRGTSTFDGLSIAWSVLEYLLDPEFSGCKVLFATHYHEITSLGDSYGVVNYNATVKDWDNRVIFLRKIVQGCASKSYGVEVARMAGLPDSVIKRAKEILSDLESNYGSYISMLAEQEVKRLNKKIGGKINSESNKTILNKKVKEDDLQLGLFPSPYEIIANELENLDINNLTPIEALNILDRLKKSVSNFKQ